MSEKKLLTIYFRGVCTHFRGVVPGVPHRVVLPDATALRRGTITIGNEPQNYVLFPHIAYVSPGTPEEQATDVINVPGLIEKGHIYGGVRLEIINATGPLWYVDPITPNTGDYDVIPQLTDVYPLYYPSAETVFGGRALCYLDVFHGHIRSGSDGEARHARIEMTTEGTPMLQVTPLTGNPYDLAPPIYTIPIDAEHLTIGNVGPCCPSAGDFDFLLNFLTAHDGIPSRLPKVTPFVPMQEVDPRVMEESVAQAAAAFTQFRADITRLPSTKFDGPTPTCSDTRYP